MNVFKDIDDKLKPRARSNFIRGIAYNGLYHKAYMYIPEFVSRVNELDLYNEILHAEVIRRLRKMSEMAESKEAYNTVIQIWSGYERRIYGDAIPENYEWEMDHFVRFSE